MSDDIFIKNPNREASKPQISYEPEHIRLNKKPLPMPAGRMAPEQPFVAFIDNKPISSEEGKDLIELDDNGFIIPPNILEQKKILNIESKKDGVPQVGDCILMIFGKIIFVGELNDVEEKVKSIIYGEDSDFSDKEVNADDIVVLKRLPIKIGVFING